MDEVKNVEKDINLIKEQRQFDSLKYESRFQFELSINENVICQRYFKINGLNDESLESEEFYDTLNECVDMIKDDLKSKSRVYMWFTNKMPIKLTGFTSPDGTKASEETYFDYYAVANDTSFSDEERPTDGEFVFRFRFKDYGKVLYETVWDGNVYPKYVRNSVDLSNSDAAYKGKSDSELYFALSILKAMTSDKNDLIYYIIKKICDVCSNTTDEDGDKIEYTKEMEYGGKKYSYSSYNRAFVKSWEKALEQKTRQYYAWANNSYSPKYLERIDKYL